jgi:hypothetical protein
LVYSNNCGVLQEKIVHMKIIKLILCLFLCFISFIQILLIIQRGEYGFTFTGVLRVLIPLFLIIILNLKGKTGWILCIVVSLFGLFNIYYRSSIRSDFGIMVITEPLFFYYLKGRTGNILSVLLLRFPMYLYLTLIITYLYFGKQYIFRPKSNKASYS